LTSPANTPGRANDPAIDCNRSASRKAPAMVSAALLPPDRALMARKSEQRVPASTVDRLWQDYGLSIAVGALFLGSFILHAIFGWLQYVADQTDQGSTPTLLGSHGYVIYFSEWTFQNWQSEFLEVLVLIVLTSFLIHKGSPESKDGDEELKAAVERIEKRMDQLVEKERK
jgi:hypothetical protein